MSDIDYSKHVTEKTFKVISVFSLEEIIKEHYKLPTIGEFDFYMFNLCAENNWNNDSHYLLNLEKTTFDLELQYLEEVKVKLAKAIEEQKEIDFGMSLLQLMVDEGTFPEGEYLVEVYW